MVFILFFKTYLVRQIHAKIYPIFDPDPSKVDMHDTSPARVRQIGHVDFEP